MLRLRGPSILPLVSRAWVGWEEVFTPRAVAPLLSLREFGSLHATPNGSTGRWLADQLQPVAAHAAAAPAASAVAWRLYSSGPGAPTQLPRADGTLTKQVLYRGRGVRLFRVLVRLKVFQLAGVAALAVPITTFLGTGQVSGLQGVVAASLLIGSGVASTALWFYSRRYVGELALLRPAASAARAVDGAAAGAVAPAAAAGGRAPAAATGAAVAAPLVRLSVLDFWGHREDNDVALARLVPPLAGLPRGVRSAVAAEPLLPLDVEGDRQYYLSIRYGHLADASTLQQLLAGELPEQQRLAEEAEQLVAEAVAAQAPAGLGVC